MDDDTFFDPVQGDLFDPEDEVPWLVEGKERSPEVREDTKADEYVGKILY